MYYRFDRVASELLNDLFACLNVLYLWSVNGLQIMQWRVQITWCCCCCCCCCCLWLCLIPALLLFQTCHCWKYTNSSVGFKNGRLRKDMKWRSLSTHFLSCFDPPSPVYATIRFRSMRQWYRSSHEPIQIHSHNHRRVRNNNTQLHSAYHNALQ